MKFVLELDLDHPRMPNRIDEIGLLIAGITQTMAGSKEKIEDLHHERTNGVLLEGFGHEGGPAVYRMRVVEEPFDTDQIIPEEAVISTDEVAVYKRVGSNERQH